MVYFANRDLNRIYVHVVLQGFAENAGGIFVFVYLLRAGFSTPLVLCTVAALVLFRIVARQPVVPFARRFGVRSSLMLGTVLKAISYLALAFVEQPDGKLVFYVMLVATGEAFYWTSFHATVARLGDAHVRGAQTSAIQLIYAVTSVVGPIAGGLAMAYIGPKSAFFGAAVLEALAAIPLGGLPLLEIPAKSKLDTVSARLAARTYFFDGIAAVGNTFAWSIALFITLGQQFQSYGLAQAAAALCGAFMALLLGRLIDKGHPKRSAFIGLSAMMLTILIKALGFADPVLALVGLGAGAVALPLYASAYNSRIYTLASASGDALRFHVQGEGGWDLGTALAAFIAAGCIQFGFGFTLAIAVGLLGIAGVGLMIRRGFQKPEPSLRT